MNGGNRDEGCKVDLEEVGCNLCGHLTSTIILDTKEKFIVRRCKECGLVFLSPRLKKSDLLKYYNNASTTITCKDLETKEKFYRERFDIHMLVKSRKVFFSRIFRIIGANAPQKKIKLLDIGCNDGMLMDFWSEMATDIGCGIDSIIGIEPNKDAACKSMKKGYRVHVGTVDDFPKIEKFDIVIMNDVVEHLCDPLSTLSQVKELLADKGLIFIRVPNIQSLLIKQSVLKPFPRLLHYQGIWAIPEHTYNFNFKILSEYGKKLGLKVVKKGISPHELYSADLRGKLAVAKNYFDRLMWIVLRLATAPNIWVLMKRKES